MSGRFRGPRWVVSNTGYETPCWLWQGCLNHKGYGVLRDGDRIVYAHRFYYEQVVDKIPEGLQLHHLCGVRRCMRPDHVEPVSLVENQHKRWSSIRSFPKGHSY